MELYLLGTFQALGKDGEEFTFRSNRERALLAYLAVEAEQSHRREAIAALFWPDADEKQARNNLRVTLHRLRQALEEESGERELLQVSRNELRMEPDAGDFVDERALSMVIERTNRHGHNGRHRCSHCIGELEGVVDYYRGEFLKGFSLEDSLLFSEWVLLRQQRLHGYILRALYDLSAFHMAGGNLSRALDFANRQLELEPWREEAHRQVMSILASGGERTAALNQYEICRDLLEKELGIGPSEETVALYEQIRRGESLDTRPPPAPERVSEIGPAVVEVEGELPPKTAQPAGRRVGWAGVKRIVGVGGILLLVVLGLVVGRMYLGRVTVYDDFNDNTAGGIPDAGRWLFPHAGPGDSCNFVQQEGRLKFIPGEGIGPDGCALRVAAPETSPGSELGSLSVQMRLLKRHEAGNLIVGLRVSSTFEDGDWNLDCSLVAGPDFTSFEMIVSDTRRGQVLYSAREDINPDEWYEVGLAVDGETMAVSCLLNGVEIGRYEPENPELLQTVPFVREILVLDATAVLSEVWFDDFRVDNNS